MKYSGIARVGDPASADAGAPAAPREGHRWRGLGHRFRGAWQRAESERSASVPALVREIRHRAGAGSPLRLSLPPAKRIDGANRGAFRAWIKERIQEVEMLCKT